MLDNQYPFKSTEPVVNATADKNYYQLKDRLSPENFETVLQVMSALPRATNGKDIKTLLIRLVETFMEVLIKSGDPDATLGYIFSEIENAKMGSGTLRERLDELVNEANNSLIGMNRFTQELKEYLADVATKGFPVVGERAVSPINLSFSVPNSNLHDTSKDTKGYYLSSSTGDLVAGAGFSVSDFIRVYNFKTLYIKRSRRVVYYDINKKRIGSHTDTSATSKVAELPEGTYYIRYDWSDSDFSSFRPQVNGGSVELPYEAYKLIIPSDYLELSGFFATPQNSSFIEKSRNAFNKATIKHGVYLNVLNGNAETAHADYNSSDYINVLPNEDWVADKPLRFVAFYDNLKKPLAGLTNQVGTFKIPLNVGSMRVSFTKGYEETLQLERGTVSTTYQNFGYVLSKDIQVEMPEKEISVKTEIVTLPPKLWAIVNDPVEIYDNNIVSDSKALTFDYEGVGKQLTGKWTHTPTVAGTEDLSVEIYRDFEKVGSVTTKVVTTDVKTQDRKVLIVGDSTVNEGIMTQRLLDRYAQESSGLTLVGTRGKNGNLHEGRGGWTVQRYRTNAIYENVANPFYNPTTQDFDFNYYMAQNGYSGLTDVIFQLGINDTFSLKLDNYVDGIKKILTHYETLIQSVRKYDPNIKIGIAVTIPPTNSQDVFGEAYGAGTPLWRYKKINAYWISELVKHFGNRDGENIQLIAQNNVIEAGVDHRDGVHLTPEGYAKLGNAVYAYLKNN